MELTMKKSLLALSLISSVALANPLIVTQSNPKGTNHDTVSTIITTAADANKQEYKYIVGKSCVNGVSAWNDAGNKDPVVLTYSTPSARLSAETGTPCIPDTNNDTIKVWWTGRVPIMLCGTDKSKPFTERGVKLSTAPSHVGFANIVRSSGYDWKYTRATSSESMLMLSNGDIDYGLISAAFADKLKGNPKIKCDYADLPDRTQKPIKSALNLKYDPDPTLDATVIIISKNLSKEQEAMIAKSISKKNPEFVGGVDKFYRPVDMPPKGQDQKFLRELLQSNMSVGYLLKSIAE